MEEDDEIKGDGLSYDFGARMLDSRVGRWFSPDPAENLSPMSSTYSAMYNNPISYIDPDGENPIRGAIAVAEIIEGLFILGTVYATSEALKRNDEGMITARSENWFVNFMFDIQNSNNRKIQGYIEYANRPQADDFTFIGEPASPVGPVFSPAPAAKLEAEIFPDIESTPGFELQVSTPPTIKLIEETKTDVKVGPIVADLAVDYEATLTTTPPMQIALGFPEHALALGLQTGSIPWFGSGGRFNPKDGWGLNMRWTKEYDADYLAISTNLHTLLAANPKLIIHFSLANMPGDRVDLPSNLLRTRSSGITTNEYRAIMNSPLLLSRTRFYDKDYSTGRYVPTVPIGFPDGW